MSIELIGIILIGGIVGLGIERRKRSKVQDRQFRMLLARLNEITGRESDDFTSPIDDENPVRGKE